MPWYMLLPVIALAAFAIYQCDRLRTRRLKRRQPVQQAELADVSAESPRGVAFRIVTESISRCFGVEPSQVRLEDDIHYSFLGPEPLAAATIDDPSEEIIETIRERIEVSYPGWDLTGCGSRVCDIIDSLANHIARFTGQRLVL